MTEGSKPSHREKFEGHGDMLDVYAVRILKRALQVSLMPLRMGQIHVKNNILHSAEFQAT